MLAAERRDLAGVKADEASAFHRGFNPQGMGAAVGHALFDGDIAGLGEAGRNGACGRRFKIFRNNDAGQGTRLVHGAAGRNNTQHHG